MRTIVVGLISGLLFGTLDGVINANPLAQRLLAVYKPIAKSSINVPAGMVIDLIFGLVMAYIFLLLYKGLPGATGLQKGLSYAVILWFFRVVMSVASNWMMFEVPPQTLAYTLFSGLVEMLLLGIFYGLLLKP